MDMGRSFMEFSRVDRYINFGTNDAEAGAHGGATTSFPRTTGAPAATKHPTERSTMPDDGPGADGAVGRLSIQRPDVPHRIRYTATEWQDILEAAQTCHKSAFDFVRETSLTAARGRHSAPR